MLRPLPFLDTWTSSASPAITARPSCAGSAARSCPSGPVAGCGGHAMPSSPAAAVLVTTTSNRSPAPVSATRTGSPGQCSWCTSTAREHASPTASRTSSSSASGTPLRRATAVATSRAVRTCAGSGVNVISTVGIVSEGAASLLRLPGGDGLVHAVMDAEDLGQPGDPEDLQDALLRAHQVQRAVVRTDTLEAADEHTQAGGVKELHLLHVHHELVVPAVHEVDEKLTQPRGGIDVDLALDVDDLNPVRRVMLQLQVHKILPRHAVFRRRLCWRPPAAHPEAWAPRRAFNHALTSCLHEFTLRGIPPATQGAVCYQGFRWCLGQGFAAGGQTTTWAAWRHARGIRATRGRLHQRKAQTCPPWMTH